MGPPLTNSSPNLKSAHKLPHIITDYLAKECQAGHTASPFDKPPFTPFHISPIGGSPRKGTQQMATHNVPLVPTW